MAKKSKPKITRCSVSHRCDRDGCVSCSNWRAAGRPRAKVERTTKKRPLSEDGKVVRVLMRLIVQARRRSKPSIAEFLAVMETLMAAFAEIGWPASRVKAAMDSLAADDEGD